jgi:hypothetical protein
MIRFVMGPVRPVDPDSVQVNGRPIPPLAVWPCSSAPGVVLSVPETHPAWCICHHRQDAHWSLCPASVAPGRKDV